MIGPFSRTHPNSFSILARILLFPVLTRILPFLGTHIDWTLFQNSPEQFFDTRTDSTFSWYSPGFCHFLVLTLIGPFSGTYPNCFWILARILLFPGTHPDSAIFRYSHSFKPFSVLARTIFRHTLGFYLFPVLARILSSFDTQIDSTLLRYLPKQFFDTRM